LRAYGATAIALKWQLSIHVEEIGDRKIQIARLEKLAKEELFIDDAFNL
jgi:hypothetical protein